MSRSVRRYSVLACILGATVSLAACSSTVASQVTASPVAITSSPATTARSLVTTSQLTSQTPVAGVTVSAIPGRNAASAKQPRATHAPPVQDVKFDTGGLSDPTPTDNGYWATDYCHYHVTDGVTYGDYCMRNDLDANGNAVVGLYGIYAYPYPPGVELYQFDTTIAGFTVYRDLSNALFNTVKWMAWPPNTVLTYDNISVQLADSETGQNVWLTINQVIQAASENDVARYGFTQTEPVTTLSVDAQAWVDGYIGNLANSLASVWVQPDCGYPNACVTYTN